MIDTMPKNKDKEIKTNRMRILDGWSVDYRYYTYECGEFIDALHTARSLNQPPEKLYKTLVTEGAPRQYYVFVIPIAMELDLKKAARVVGTKSLAMIPVKDINFVTGYIRGGCTSIGMKKKYPTVIDSSANHRKSIIVSGGRIGLQIELAPEDLLRVTSAQFADVVAGTISVGEMEKSQSGE